MSAAGKIIDRTHDLKKIEGSIKNKFKWDWLEEKDLNNDFISTYMRKTDEAGLAG
jgi:hypothetical protein